jgi:hypothetical protein
MYVNGCFAVFFVKAFSLNDMEINNGYALKTTNCPRVHFVGHKSTFENFFVHFEKSPSQPTNDPQIEVLLEQTHKFDFYVI